MKRRQRLGVSFTVAAVLCLTLNGCGQSRPPFTIPPCTPGHAALVKAVGSRLPGEPRLTGGFVLAVSGSRGAAPSPSGLRAAAREIAEELRRHPSPRTRHASGVLFLILGQPEKAVLDLETADAADPRNAAVLIDLTAAYLARAAALDQPLDRVAALSAAEQAYRLSPGSAEAAFNRALVLQKLSLAAQADQAWQAYLKLDGSSGWSEEAQTALRKLRVPTEPESWEKEKGRLLAAARSGDEPTVRKLVDRFRQDARLQAEEELLPAWAELWQRDPSAAGSGLTVTRTLSRAVAAASGDRLLADTLSALDRVLATDPKRASLTALGLRSYGKGLSLVKERRFSEAEAPLRQARAALGRAGSPFEGWATFLLLRCAYQRSDTAEAEQLATALLAATDSQAYPILAARAHWVRGTTRLGTARPAEALADYQAALALFKRTGEAVNQTAVHTLLASTLNELGDSSAAWRHRDQAIRGLAVRNDPTRLRLALTEAAFAALSAGYADAAAVLQTEALGLAEKAGDPLALTSAYLNRGSILYRAGAKDRSLIDLSAARRLCPKIPDLAVRDSVSADLYFAEGQVRDSLPAVEALNAALAIYERTGQLLLVPHVLHLRARAALRLGREAAAAADLEAALGLLELERGALPLAEHRAAFLDRFANIFDDRIDLEARKGQAGLALDVSERSRARLLLDWLSALPAEVDGARARLASATHPRPSAELQRHLPDGLAVVSYEILTDRLLLWVIRRDSIRLREVALPADRLREHAVRFRESARTGEELARREAQILYDALLGPIQGDLKPNDRLALIPDGPLFGIPLGALENARSGRTLAEERTYGVVPSLNVLIGILQRPPHRSFAEASILLVENPAFDRALLPDLPSLPGAEEEGTIISGLYRNARVVRGGQATRAAFLGGLGTSRILHFSGHALANARVPFLSALALAPGPKDSGILYAREMLGPFTPGTDLVVLASCGSASGAAPPGEGLAGFVWPLLSRGVPMVVASLWEVEDREAGRLLTTFHRRLAGGEPPTLALRQAQRETIAADRRAGRSSLAWAAFEIYGADPAPGPAF